MQLIHDHPPPLLPDAPLKGASNVLADLVGLMGLNL